MNAPAPKLPDPIAATPSPPPAAASPPAPAPNEPAAPAATPPAAPAGEAKKPATTLYDAAGVDPPGKEGSTTWPTDWRDQMATAAEDPKAAKLLERFQTPAEVAKALLAAQQKIRSGEYKRAAPATDNPEELKAWREEQGIPETPDGYELPAVPGVDMANLDEGTKASLSVLREGLHKAGLNKEQGGVVSQALLQLAEKQAEAQALKDAEAYDNLEDTLRADWGPDFRKNANMNGALLSQHFGADMQNILQARMPDGTKLEHSAAFNKFLNNMARSVGSDEMFTGDASGGTSIDSRLAQIRQIMETDFGRYRREGLDVEYGQLLEKQEARTKR